MSSEVPVFQAPPSDERRVVANRNEQKVSHPSLIPTELLRDEFLNSLIHESLPRNYNFEVQKTIWKIKQTDSRRVLLQLPEGLIRFGPVLVDIFRAYFSQNAPTTDIQFITMGDLTYGACCIDDYLASSMGCDLIVHYAHSCLVPINQLKSCVKYLYIFLDIKFDLDHVKECVRHNFSPQEHKIAIASTIQFAASVHELAKHLRQQLQFDIVLPQSRPLSSGEVLGCTAPKLDPTVNTILFICDGRFHLEALMIANPTVKAYRYDPYSRKITHEAYAFDEMYEQRWSAIKRTAEVIRSGGIIGFVLGTLGRQGNERVFDTLVDRLRASNSQCNYVKVLMPEVLQDHLAAFEKVDAWVQVACPRLSIDWGSFFAQPLLNPYEFAMTIKYLAGPPTEADKPTDKSYPMDFYAKQSCGDHTPNHSCLNNQSCNCSGA